MNRRMTDSAVGRLGSETAVKRRSSGMTAEAQVRSALMGQHMSVRTPMNLMTGRAAFYP